MAEGFEIAIEQTPEELEQKRRENVRYLDRRIVFNYRASCWQCGYVFSEDEWCIDACSQCGVERVCYKVTEEKCRGCKRKYHPEEHTLRQCPSCGEERFCIARKTRCRKCNFRFIGEMSDLVCPLCGESRMCRRKSVIGKSVCYKHGAGAVRKGRRGGRPPSVARPRTYGLPDIPLKDSYLKALASPNWASLRDDIAVTTAMIEDALRELERPVSSIVEQLEKAWAEFERAQTILESERRNKAMREALDEIGRLIAEGGSLVETRKDIRASLETKRRLVDTEMASLKTLHQMMSVEQVLFLMDDVGLGLKEVIFEVIPDEGTRRVLVGRVIEVLGDLLLSPDDERRIVQIEAKMKGGGL